MAKTPVFHFPGGRNNQIMYGDNLISRKVCSSLIKECLAYYEYLFRPGVTLGGLDSSVKNSSDFSFSKGWVDSVGVDSSNFAYFENEIVTGLYMAVARYVQEYEELWRWPGMRDTGFRLQRYTRNFGYYRTHVDGSPWDQMPSYGPRVLGVVIYLNDIEVGGSTYFPDHDIHVPAKAGRISIFPTNWTHPHMGQTPITDDKWMISTFMVCDVRQLENPEEPKLFSETEETSDVEQEPTESAESA